MPTTNITKQTVTAVDVSKIFRIFRTDYGSLFVSQFKSPEQVNEAKARWASKLSKMTYKEIMRGLDTMGGLYKKFPPTLNEFIDLCVDDGMIKIEYHKSWEAEEIKAADKNKAREAMKKIRAGLGIK